MVEPDLVLPESCNEGGFWRGIEGYVGVWIGKLEIAALLDRLRGKVDEEVPTREELIQWIVEDTFAGVKKTLMKRPDRLDGMGNGECFAYFCGVANKKLRGYRKRLRRRAKETGTVVRMEDSAGGNPEADDTFTVGSQVEDPNGSTPFTSVAVRELSREVKQFLSEQFRASRPHMEEFHELVTGLHDACWNESNQTHESLSIRNAVKFLDGQYPPHIHNKDRYHQDWLKIFQRLKVAYGVELTTKPRGPQTKIRKTQSPQAVKE